MQVYGDSYSSYMLPESWRAECADLTLLHTSELRTLLWTNFNWQRCGSRFSGQPGGDMWQMHLSQLTGCWGFPWCRRLARNVYQTMWPPVLDISWADTMAPCQVQMISTKKPKHGTCYSQSAVAPMIFKKRMRFIRTVVGVRTWWIVRRLNG